jgi:murein L,D-transpeptidase YafK
MPRARPIHVLCRNADLLDVFEEFEHRLAVIRGHAGREHDQMRGLHDEPPQHCWLGSLEYAKAVYVCGPMLAGRHLARLSVAAALLLLPPPVFVRAQEALSDSQLQEPRTKTDFVTGSPLLIRIFKEESQLELWMQRAETFELLATYPICFWSGALGPKLFEGDRQAPEGFYAIGLHQFLVSGKHARSFDIGFPNAFDHSLGRTGSHILLHGGCRSVGCFAMTDPVMDRIYALAERALRAGQDQIQVHIFPFRMSDANLQWHSNSTWYTFWSNLKQGYDAFEATRTAPFVHACRGSYLVTPTGQGSQDTNPAPSGDCPPVVAEVRSGLRAALAGTPPLRRGQRLTQRAATPLALPRDNVAECIRLWARHTGVSQEHWKAICRQLDFQPKRSVRSAHRSS